MPVRKHANRKNLSPYKQNDKVVPSKEVAGKRKIVPETTRRVITGKRVNALAAQGKKKRPK